MRKLEEYKKHAKDCRALAAKVTRPEDKITLEELAEEWEKVAERRERDLHNANEQLSNALGKFNA